MLTIVQSINLFMDSFVIGYQSKEAMILSMESSDNDSDRIKAIMDGEIKELFLAPGYVKVEEGSKYLFHVFVNSKIAVPVKVLAK